ALLSTCNRMEIYYFQNGDPALAEKLEDLFHPGDLQVTFHIYHHVGLAAVQHLYQVAAGLDSLVLGEEQILSQVREAGKQNQEKSISGPVLSKLFSKASDAGRKIRGEHPGFTLGQNRSVSQAVLNLIASRFLGKKPNILLVG